MDTYTLVEIDDFGFDPKFIKGYVIEEEPDEEGEMIKRLIVLYDGHMIKVKDEDERLIKYLREKLNVKIIKEDEEQEDKEEKKPQVLYPKLNVKSEEKSEEKVVLDRASRTKWKKKDNE